MRRQALDIFINRIASHHELQPSEDLRTFLQAGEEVMFLNFNTLFFLELILFSLASKLISELLHHFVYD